MCFDLNVNIVFESSFHLEHNTTSKINFCSVATFLAPTLIRVVASPIVVLLCTWQLFMVSFPFCLILTRMQQSLRCEQTFFTASASTASQHQVKVCYTVKHHNLFTAHHDFARRVAEQRRRAVICSSVWGE